MGGVSGDGQSLFAVTGNTVGASQWSDGEAVFRHSSDLAPSASAKDYFAPKDWRELDNSDLDLGGTAAIPLDVSSANGAVKLIFPVGKSGEAYLLDRDNLGGVGGAAASAKVATNVVIASPAALRTSDGVLVVLQGDGARCPRNEAEGGLIALRVRTTPSLGLETTWYAAIARAGSPVITTTDGHSNAIVWVLGAEGDNRLHAFRAYDGQQIANGAGALSSLRHVQTLIVGDDQLFAAANGKIYAFVF
jgi:hypothetical protein